MPWTTVAKRPDALPAYTDTATTALYDAFNPWGPPDNFYLALAGGTQIDILDLACGTGKLACAYANLGHRVTAVDSSMSMLRHARGKPGADGIEWHCADALQWQTTARYDLITLTGHAFQCLKSSDEAQALFLTVRNWLKPESKFTFETRNPQIDWPSVWQDRLGHARLADGREVREHTRAWQLAPDSVRVEQDYRIGDQQLSHTDTLRFSPQCEIECQLAVAGLRFSALHGDWQGGEFDVNHSKEMVFSVIPASAPLE